MPHNLHLRVRCTDMWDEETSNEPRLQTGILAEFGAVSESGKAALLSNRHEELPIVRRIWHPAMAGR